VLATPRVLRCRLILKKEGDSNGTVQDAPER